MASDEAAVREWLSAVTGERRATTEEYVYTQAFTALVADTVGTLPGGAVSVVSLQAALEAVYRRSWADLARALPPTAPPALAVCLLLLARTVDCERKDEYIAKILDLSEETQGVLMEAIERTSAQEIASLKASLREAEGAKAALFSRLVKAEEAGKAVSALRDEIDVLRPLAAGRERAEGAVDRLKAKLEEVPGLRESLRKSAEAGAALTARVLDLEREAGRLGPLTLALSEAKDARAQGEVRISELQAALAEAQAGATELRSALQAATEVGSAAQWAGAVGGGEGVGSGGGFASELAHHLGFTPCGEGQGQGEGGQDGAPASSSSLTEFSPELSERLARLERENAELKSGVDVGSVERVSRLEQEVDDTRRIKAAFEARMRQAQGQAAALQRELEGVRCVLGETQAALSSREAELAGARGGWAETRAALACSEASTAALAARLAEEHAAHLSASAASTSRVDALCADLSAARASCAAVSLTLAEYTAAHSTSDAEAAGRLAELHSVCDGLRGELAGERERMAALEARLGSDAGQAATALSCLQGRVEALASTVREREAELAGERERVAGMEAMKAKGLDMVRALREEKSRLEGTLARAEVQAEEMEGALAQAHAETAAGYDAVEALSAQLHTAVMMQEAESERCRRLRSAVEAAEAGVAKARREAEEATGGAAASRLALMEADILRLSTCKEWYASRADVLARYALSLSSLLTSGATLPPCLLTEARLPDDVVDRVPDLQLVGLGAGEDGEAPGEAGGYRTGGAAGRGGGKGGRSGGARRVAIAQATACVDPVLAWAGLLDPVLREAEATRQEAVLEAAAALRAKAGVEAERNALELSLSTERAHVVREGLRFARLTRELESKGIRVAMKVGAEAWLDHAAGGGGEGAGGPLAPSIPDTACDASMFELDLAELLGGGGGGGQADHGAPDEDGHPAVLKRLSEEMEEGQVGEDEDGEYMEAEAFFGVHPARPAATGFGRPVLPPAAPGTHAARTSVFMKAASLAQSSVNVGGSGGGGAGAAGGHTKPLPQEVHRAGGPPSSTPAAKGRLALGL